MPFGIETGSPDPSRGTPREMPPSELDLADLEPGDVLTTNGETAVVEEVDDLFGAETTVGNISYGSLHEWSLVEEEQSEGLLPVGFERQRPSGRFAPEDIRPDPVENVDRAPDGKFVSKDREPIEDFGRRPSDGLFDLF